uniref:RNA-directed DNA polymerase, eukaryota, reverse transcriptase zinc-binding domain protein n=1 Tax=Tanacetum cinerariifolium TaxID=118510 RepID=A0A699H419_TANCI|nr:RNA-directed DNA polymerase, eukaryota, reverse transcriptase zinc-binding domain protein [Tanacetum cinerariifolium]
MLCRVCDKGIESTDHLFCGCELAKELMVEVGSWWSLDIPSIDSFLNWQVWFESLNMSKVKKDCLEVVFLTLWWRVWNFRNASLFVKKNPKRSLCMDNIATYALLWINGKCKKDEFKLGGLVYLVRGESYGCSDFILLSGIFNLMLKPRKSVHNYIGKSLWKSIIYSSSQKSGRKKFSFLGRGPKGSNPGALVIWIFLNLLMASNEIIRRTMRKVISKEAQTEQYPTESSIECNEKYELSEELLKELRCNSYSERVEEDVIGHIAKILEVLDSIKVDGLDPFQLRMITSILSLSRNVRKWWMNEGDGKINTWEELVSTGVKETAFVQQYVLLPLWSNGSKDPQNTDADVAFDVKEPESEVHVSTSSNDKTKKHDEKTKREAKGKSPVELCKRVRDLNDEFEEFFVNSTNGVNAASTPVTAVGLYSTNNTNSFSAAGPSNTAISLNFEIGGKSSFVDPSQYPDDPKHACFGRHYLFR